MEQNDFDMFNTCTREIALVTILQALVAVVICFTFHTTDYFFSNSQSLSFIGASNSSVSWGKCSRLNSAIGS